MSKVNTTADTTMVAIKKPIDSNVRMSSVVVERLTPQQIKRVDNPYYKNYCPPTKKDFMRSLGLIANHHLIDHSLNNLQQKFPLRTIARTGPQVRDDCNQLVLDQNVCEKSVIKLRKKKNKSKRVVKTVTFTEAKMAKRRIAMTAKFPIGSPLFGRLCRTLRQSLTPEQVTQSSLRSLPIAKYESNKELLDSKDEPFLYNRWTAASIERKCHRSELSVRLNTRVRKRVVTTHWITFNRRQRLEKIIQIRTGLNWKLRLQMRHCKKLTVRVERLQVTECSVCRSVFTENNLCHHLVFKRIQSQIIESITTTEDQINWQEDQEPIEQTIDNIDDNQFGNKTENISSLIDKFAIFKDQLQVIEAVVKQKDFTQITANFEHISADDCIMKCHGDKTNRDLV